MYSGLTSLLRIVAGYLPLNVCSWVNVYEIAQHSGTTKTYKKSKTFQPVWATTKRTKNGLHSIQTNHFYTIPWKNLPIQRIAYSFLRTNYQFIGIYIYLKLSILDDPSLEIEPKIELMWIMIRIQHIIIILN